MQNECTSPHYDTVHLSQGVIAAIPIAVGYWPVAMAYGLLAKSVGLTFFECVGMSIIVYAGASQFMALNLIATGVGMGEIILATFLINLRHFLMSASISEKMLASHRGLRAVLSFGITDESFAVASIKGEKIGSAYLAGLELLSYSSWVICSGVGYVVGVALPGQLQASMGIALYAMFIGLLIPPAKKSRKIVFLGASAALLNGLFTLILSGGWPMIAATVLASLGMALFEEKKGEINE